MEAPQRSDALVFFGATGDLAHKKIFPALQAMGRRGRLDVPVIGVAKAGWGLEQLRARARESVEQHGGLDPTAFETARRPAALRRRRLPRPRDLRGAAQGARHRAPPDPLSSHPAERLRDRRRGPRPFGMCERRAHRRGEALRARPRLGPRPQRDPPFGLRRIGDLPHRPLPRQGAGAEPVAVPLREHLPGADLEPQLRGERADHHGRALRRAGPRQVLRGGGRDPRRDPEPHAAGGEPTRHGGRRPRRITSRSGTSR